MPTSHVYKVVDGCEIRLDAYPGRRKRAPVAVWIHGGALLAGDRGDVRPDVRRLLSALGFALVSIDHRLAPETKLAAIHEDLADAFAWIGARAADLLGADGGRTVAIGESAGGYLALSAGYRARPRPDAIVSIAGYGSLSSSWYTEPSRFYRLSFDEVTKRQAHSVIRDRCITRARWEDRAALYLYTRQTGTWPEYVIGPGALENASMVRPFEPLHHVDGRFPPTLLIHGTEDTDVPFEESERMAGALRRGGRPHRLLRLEGAGHTTAGAGVAGHRRIRDAIREHVSALAIPE